MLIYLIEIWIWYTGIDNKAFLGDRVNVLSLINAWFCLCGRIAGLQTPTWPNASTATTAKSPCLARSTSWGRTAPTAWNATKTSTPTPVRNAKNLLALTARYGRVVSHHGNLGRVIYYPTAVSTSLTLHRNVRLILECLIHWCNEWTIWSSKC